MDINRIEKALYIFKLYGMNHLEIMLWNSEEANDVQQMWNAAQAKANSTRVRSRVIIPNSSYDILTPAEYTLKLKDYTGDKLIVFKAPKKPPLVEGMCEPSYYYNKISLNNSDIFQTIWGDTVLQPFPIALKKTVFDLNAMLVR